MGKKLIFNIKSKKETPLYVLFDEKKLMSQNLIATLKCKNLRIQLKFEVSCTQKSTIVNSNGTQCS